MPNPPPLLCVAQSTTTACRQQRRRSSHTRAALCTPAAQPPRAPAAGCGAGWCPAGSRRRWRSRRRQSRAQTRAASPAAGQRRPFRGPCRGRCLRGEGEASETQALVRAGEWRSSATCPRQARAPASALLAAMPPALHPASPAVPAPFTHPASRRPGRGRRRRRAPP